MIDVRHDHMNKKIINTVDLKFLQNSRCMGTKIRNRKRLAKSITWILASCGIMMTLLPAFVWSQRKVSPAPSPTVVFICEHGAARSVIAAAYFNKLAAERHLNFHAIARGIAAQPDLSASAVTGLQRDNVPFPREKPRNATYQEVQRAVRVVAFCRVPDSLSGTKRLETFDVPAPNDAGYEASRDAIMSHVKAVIDELVSESVPPRATRRQ